MTSHAEAEVPEVGGRERAQVIVGRQVKQISAGYGYLIADGAVTDVRDLAPGSAPQVRSVIREPLGECAGARRSTGVLTPRRGKLGQRHAAEPIDDAGQFDPHVVDHDYSRPEAMIAKRRRNSR
jgi:hypothetical protein